MEPQAPAVVQAEVPQKPAPGAETLPAAEPAEVKPERTFSQTELDEILEKRLSKERRKREELKTERDVLRKLALERDPPKPEPQKPTEGEPTREKYASYEEFIEARAEWRADQRVDKKLQERETQDRERQAKSKQDQERDAFRKAMKESAKDIEDFDEVLAEIKNTDPVANINVVAVEAADAPGKILYHLAKHPDEAERIASLSPGKQAREILRLEEKLAKPPVKTSKAPEPITPVGGKAAVGDEMPDAAKEPDKWLRWREKNLAAAKRPRAS